MMVRIVGMKMGIGDGKIFMEDGDEIMA